MRKKILISIVSLLIIITMLTSCGENTSYLNIVKTGGSTSVEKVMNALIYKFQEDHHGITVSYEMNGSGDGIKNTLSGLYEIGHSSRELKDDGTESGLEVIPYALDGIAVIVNPNNHVDDITEEQLYKIYTGKINNWKQVGGSYYPITVVTREFGSGTREAFSSILGLERKNENKVTIDETKVSDMATTCNHTGAVQTEIAQNENAIGYLSFSDMDIKKIKPLKLNGISISDENLKNGNYILKRDFYLLVKKDELLTDYVDQFIQFILSEEGKSVIIENGLLAF